MRGLRYRLLLAAIAPLGLAALLLFTGPVAGAADDDAGPLLAFVQTAVANGRVEPSRVLGFNNPNKQFTETPDEGAVLVGFDLGLGKFFDTETIYAVRALYWTRHGDLRLQDHGLFRDKRLPTGKVLKSKVLHTVHVQARPGYAVGGLTIRSGLYLNGLSVTFMKIDGAALDPRQAYTSDWIGDRTGGGEASIDGNGAAVVGLFGSQDNELASALGLIYAPAPVAAVAPPAEPAHAEPSPVPSPRPAVAPPPVVPPPVAPAAAPKPVEPAEALVETPPVEASAAPKHQALVTAPAAQSGLPLWATVGIPVGVFGGVACAVLLFVLIPFGQKAKDVGPRNRANMRPAPPVSPSARSRRPGPRKRRAPEMEEVIELREEDVLSVPAPLEEPLFDALPVEPAPRAAAHAAVSNARPDDATWPRLEL